MFLSSLARTLPQRYRVAASLRSFASLDNATSQPGAQHSEAMTAAGVRRVAAWEAPFDPLIWLPDHFGTLILASSALASYVILAGWIGAKKEQKELLANKGLGVKEGPTNRAVAKPEDRR